MHDVYIIERAFQLARECGSIAEVRRRLMNEGYLSVDAHLRGRQIQRDLSSRLDPNLRPQKAQKAEPSEESRA